MYILLGVWLFFLIADIVLYAFVKDKYASDIPHPGEHLLCAMLPLIQTLLFMATITRLCSEYQSKKSSTSKEDEIPYVSVTRTKLKVHTVEGIRCYVVNGEIYTLPIEAQKGLYSGELYMVVRNGQICIEHEKGN